MRLPLNSTAFRCAVLALLLLTVQPSFAGKQVCEHCGCQCACRKICRLECTEKKITTTCYSYTCEDHCLPGPGCRGCLHVDVVGAEETDDQAPCPAPKLRAWYDWTPGSFAKLATRRKLHKKIVTKTVPSYKWVVEDVCERCLSQVEPAPVPPHAMIPPVPSAENAMIIGGASQPPAR